MIRTALILVRKDLRLFMRDRTALFFLLVLPIGLGAVMGTAMGGGMMGGGTKARKVAIAVEDQDQTPTSEALVGALMDIDDLRVELLPDARRLVADGDRAGGLVIPSGYGEALVAGQPLPALVLYRDPARQIASQIMLFQLSPVLFQQAAKALGSGMMDRVTGLMGLPEPSRGAVTAELVGSYMRVENLMAGMEAEWQDSAPPVAEPAAGEAEGGRAAAEPDEAPLATLMDALPSMIGLEVEDLAPPRADGLPRSAGASHAFAAMAVMMLLFNLVAFAGTLLEERAEGTLDRLRLTAEAGRAVLLGKILVTMLLASIQLLELFSFGALAFQVPVMEHLPALAITSLTWALAASALGLLFATACRTRKQMEGLSTLVILVMSAVGGAWFPREITPEWMQTAGLATPVAWAMDAFHGVLWYGKGVLDTPELSGVYPSLLVLAAGATVMLTVAFRLYQRRFESA
ncbi:MAG: ABC transporter permease [Planctomycetota bacterium]|nr:ABC transporter permease [Planctomycetota bacterium]MDG1984404.1 ABC transporter permease [Planctomycetota bacterium]